MFISKFVKWFLVSIAVVILTACGGGSSSNTVEETVTTYYETVVFEGKELEAYNEYLDAADKLNYEEVNTTLNSNTNIEVIFSDSYSIIFKIGGIEFTHTNKALRDNNTSFGSDATSKQSMIKPQTTFSQKPISISTNKSAILFLPFFSEFGSSEVIEIQNLLNNNGFNITIKTDEEVTVEEVANSLEKYDLIYFSTHGREDGSMVLGEKSPEGAVIDTIKTPYLYNAVDGRIGIKPDFFKYRKLNQSLVILHACESMYKDDLSSALISSGAKVVLGWDNYIVWNNIILADVMLSQMIDTCEPFEESIIIAQQQVINDQLVFSGGDGETIDCSIAQEDCHFWNLYRMTYETAFSHLKVAYGYDTAADDFYLSADCITLDEPDLSETPLIDLLGGKTFYNVDPEWIDRISFNANVTSVTWTEIVGTDVGMTGTDTIAIDGQTLIVTSSEDGSTFSLVLAGQTSDYLLFSRMDSEGILLDQGRFYFDQAKAEGYYDELQHDLATLMVGNTFYQRVRDDSNASVFPSPEWIATMTANADGTLVVVDNGEAETMNYTIDGNTLTVVTITEGTKVHTLTAITDTYLQFDNSMDGTWYFTLESAQVAPPIIWD